MNNLLETTDPYEEMGITPEELQDKTEVDSQEIVSGTEDFKSTSAAEMAGMPQCPQGDPRGIFIRTTGDNTYRIYFKSSAYINSSMVNQLCRFLDTRSDSDTVVFMLGVDFEADCSHRIGPILSAILSCKAHTVGLAMGLCSLTETMIWAFCDERQVMRYGAITFRKPEFIKVCEEYSYYYKVFYDKIVNELHILTQEEVDEMYSKNTSIMRMYNEFNT